ncbi:hypothetical protein AB3M89_13275 [Microbacterium sp. 179-I 3D2 NHS]|uniref:hypothetical protein n=1 Tax=Microbacterium sp. 179-I 3D2 NHS TaxID=3235178 RepID=UPI00399F208D
MSSIPGATPADDDSSTYDGPDDDLASGNISDADFVQPSPDAEPSPDAPPSPDTAEADDAQVTRPSPGRDTRSQR